MELGFFQGGHVYLELERLPEPFACGLPVVTTVAGGIPLMVKHEETALVAPIGDARTLADHVLRLLREPALAVKLARQAHAWLEPHRWSSVRSKWLEVYAEGDNANRH